MAIEDTIQNMISGLGQSQRDRVAKELADHFVDIDERTPRDLLGFAHAFSSYIRYYATDASVPTCKFEPFLKALEKPEQILASSDGNTPAHLALLAAFAELFEIPREILNRITARHLDFHIERVLRFERRPAVSDRAHVLFELKKNAPAVRILPELQLSAGKDATGIERIYQPVRETVVSGARIAELCSILVDDKVRCAPVTRSSDGVGGPLEPGESFAPFSSKNAPVGVLGFALSSPVLRMAEGRRMITVRLKLAEGAATVGQLKNCLEAYLTGEKGWLGPYPVAVDPAGERVSLAFTIAEPDGAVIDHDAAVHKTAHAAFGPVLSLVLKKDAALKPTDVKGIFIQSVQISVAVSGVATSLVLENDYGALDPKKAFLPFGPQPGKGARFMIGCPEALSKSLSSLSLTVRWHGLPRSFSDTYCGYLGRTIDASYFTVSAELHHGTKSEQHPGMALFQGANQEVVLDLISATSVAAQPFILPVHHVFALGSAGSASASFALRELLATRPMLQNFTAVPPAERTGYITLALENGFLHEVFRKKSVENAVNFAQQAAANKDCKPVTTTPVFTQINEPYTPKIEKLTLDYKASTSEVEIASISAESFANPDVRFFHIEPFGQRREHAYLRRQLKHVTELRVPLFPPHDDEGEMLIGITGLSPGDSVSILIQVAEGSADPELVWPRLNWSVLCDNHWKQLGPSELVLDTTDQLRTSGLVCIVLPKEASAANTLLPAGRIWLKASVTTGAIGISRLLDVAVNGVEVQFIDHGNDPSHLDTALPKGSILKVKTPVAGVKGLVQPFSSFGGRPAESRQAKIARAAERQRHKGRASAPWDYERLVLEAFPEIHRVKCIPHAMRGNFEAPGSVLLVVVPDLRNKNARDPLAPRVSPDVLSRIRDYVSTRAAMGVAIDVQNPTFWKIRLDFEVKLRTGFAFNTYAPVLAQELRACLSPWAYDAEQEISFGGRVYKSALLNFVEERRYVDYVTDFKMISYEHTPSGSLDVHEAAPLKPDAVLVSASEHLISELTS